MKRFITLLITAAMLFSFLPAMAQTSQSIVYWAQWSETETQAEVIKESIARFEADHPEFTVEVNWAGREVRDILKTSLDSGIKIDLVEGGFDVLPGSRIGDEYFLNLDSYMANSDLEQNLLASMREFALGLSADGSWYYLPVQPFIGSVFYNKDIFDEAGVTPPTTWAEFLEVCQKIKDAGYDPLTVDDAYVSMLYTHYLGLLKGADWVTELMTDKTGANWSDPAILQMAKAYEELAAKGYFSSTVGSNVFPSAQNGELAIGTAAMYFNGSWLPNEVAPVTGPDFRWGIMFYPGVENAINEYTTLMNGCQVYAVPRNTDVPEGAFMLLEYLLDAQSQQALVDKAQTLPSIDGVQLPASLADASALMAQATGAFQWNVAKTSDSEITTLVNDAFSRLIAGKLSADDFVAEMQGK